MHPFLAYQPTRENHWRSIVLFARNVASYKFALARSLLEFRQRGDDLIRLEELAEPFSRHLCLHLAKAPRQSTSPSSRFLDTCRRFNTGEADQGELIDTTRAIGFTNVIDAFHVVNQGEIGMRFFKDERATSGGIRLTDHLYSLEVSGSAPDLETEVEARWNLVETAWALGLARQILTALRGPRRVSVTSSRSALNGYQKGQCFYCCGHILILTTEPNCADIDHFIPHTAALHLPDLLVNGIWNLVLACRDCNRGPQGKFAMVPTLPLLARLHTRNEFLIGSHHPLRETLIAQTGPTEAIRRTFLQARYNEAAALLIHNWSPPVRGDLAL